MLPWLTRDPLDDHPSARLGWPVGEEQPEEEAAAEEEEEEEEEEAVPMWTRCCPADLYFQRDRQVTITTYTVEPVLKFITTPLAIKLWSLTLKSGGLW